MASIKEIFYGIFILFSIISCKRNSYTVEAGFMTDSKKTNSNTKDASTELRVKIEKDCQSQGIILTDTALDSYTKCFKKSHIPLAYPIEDELDEALPEMRNYVDEILGDWCLDWNARTECVRKNTHYIEPCMSSDKSILMDFNLAFGDAMCSKDGRELFNVYMQFIEEGGIQCLTERHDIFEGMMTCINPLNIAHFNRNLYRVTDCIVQQLKQCPTEGPMELLRIMIDFSRTFYKSTSTTRSRQLFQNDEKNSIKQGESTSINEYVEIKPLSGGNMYPYVYLGIAFGICIWIILAISIHICSSTKIKVSDAALKSKGWQRV